MRPQLSPGARRRERRGEGCRAGGCMNSSVGGTGAGRRCPRLAEDWEERASSMSPAEGFLLSRIDGHTPWVVLREIGGPAPPAADPALPDRVTAPPGPLHAAHPHPPPPPRA